MGKNNDSDEKVFNDDFESYKKKVKTTIKKDLLKRLNIANTNNISENNKDMKLFEIKLGELFISIPKVWIDIKHDLMTKKQPIKKAFLVNNRLFYVGISMMCLVAFIWLINILTGSTINNSSKNIHNHTINT